MIFETLSFSTYGYFFGGIQLFFFFAVKKSQCAEILPWSFLLRLWRYGAFSKLNHVLNQCAFEQVECLDRSFVWIGLFFVVFSQDSTDRMTKILRNLGGSFEGDTPRSETKNATSTKWCWCYYHLGQHDWNPRGSHKMIGVVPFLGWTKHFGGKSIHPSFLGAKMVLRVPWKRGRTRWCDKSISWIWTVRSQSRHNTADMGISEGTNGFTDGYSEWMEWRGWCLGGRLLGWFGTSWGRGGQIFTEKMGSCLTEISHCVGGIIGKVWREV